MTISEMLADANCRTDVVMQFCPRGFSNERSIYPIPVEYDETAVRFANDAQNDTNNYNQLLRVEGLSKPDRFAVLNWLGKVEGEDGPELLRHEWAVMTI